jgi:hypothetical protein
MNTYIKCINYLIQKKTNTIPHSKSNLFNHLVGTYNILRKWNCSEDICFAGLLHSIYGNEFFTITVENERQVIKELIGEKAEELVYLFNQDRNINKDTSLISFANSLEQIFFTVLDNVYDKKDTDDFYFYFRDMVPWKFVGSGLDVNKWRKFTYYLDFKNEIESKLKTISENILKNLNIYNFLEEERVYASANPFGTVHEIHTDYVEGIAKGITVMFYLNNNWKIDYGGETVFLDQSQNEIVKSIIPKSSRIIVFDGGHPHCAREVRRDVNDLRMVLTFKYKINIK